MKNSIKKFVQAITRKRTLDIFQENVEDIKVDREHVVIFVDNAKPLHELSRPEHDIQIKKAIDHVCGEGCTYEVRLSKNNATHERSAHVMRESLRRR